LPVRFEWDATKERANIAKHGVDFREAKLAFTDPNRLVAVDKGPQQGGAALILHRAHWTRGVDRAIYLSVSRKHSDHWRWLLAQRQKAL